MALRQRTAFIGDAHSGLRVVSRLSRLEGDDCAGAKGVRGHPDSFVGFGASCDDQISMVFYGLLAFAVHSNNLTSPLLYGLAWRQEMQQQYSRRRTRSSEPQGQLDVVVCGAPEEATPMTMDVIMAEGGAEKPA